ncbi:MAG: DUF493 domain-containing protein, partial [Mariprofundus sp.]
MNKPQETSPISYPCRFPIKVMGSNSARFRQEIIAIALNHVGTLDDEDIRATPSRTGKYLSLTITITAE